MMEENNNIFLVYGDALVYLARPMHKKYYTTFAWGHPFRSNFQPASPFKDMYAFRVTATAVGLFQKILLNTIAYMYCTM